MGAFALSGPVTTQAVVADDDPCISCRSSCPTHPDTECEEELGCASDEAQCGTHDCEADEKWYPYVLIWALRTTASTVDVRRPGGGSG